MSTLTRMDKIWRAVAPGYAAKRLEDRFYFDSIARIGAFTGGESPYEGATTSRKRRMQALNRSHPGNEERSGLNRWDRQLLLLETRDLLRNNPTTRGIAKCFSDYAVFHGVFPAAATSDNAWNKLADDFYRDVIVPTADFRQRSGVDLVTFQKLAVQHRLIDGDCGFILMANGQLFPVESRRIDTPTSNRDDKNTTMGVKRTAKGITTGYWVLDELETGQLDRAKGRLITRERMIHPMAYDRFDQLRGIPDLASCTTKLRDMHETEEFILAKVKHEGTRLFNRNPRSGVLPQSNRRNARIIKGDNEKDQKRVEEQPWGLISTDELTAVEPKSPNSQYMPFIMHHAQSVAGALRIPLEYVLMMFTQSSFSAQRASAMHATHTFKEWTKWLVDDFLSRHRTWRIAKAIKDGELPPSPVDPRTGIAQWFLADWSVPHHGSVDPSKEADWNAKRWNNGETSLKTIIREQGNDRDRVFADKADDIFQAHVAATAAVARVAENDDLPPLVLGWRDIINTATNTQRSETTSTTEGSLDITRTGEPSENGSGHLDDEGDETDEGDE